MVVTPLRSVKDDEMTIMIRFNEESRYKSPDGQNDWLKATGVSFGPIWDARQNSIMLAYRYLEEFDYWQVCPYFHDLLGKAHQPDFDTNLGAVVLKMGETGIAKINWMGEVPTFTLSVFNFSNGTEMVEPQKYYCYGVSPTKSNRLIASYAGGSPRIKGKFSYGREIEI